MTTFYGYKRLLTVDDWRGLAGVDKWVPTRSAHELAHSRHTTRGLPEPIADAFDASGHEPLRGLSFDLCLVEKPVFLDTKFGPSMTDLMGYACNAKGDAVVLEPRPTRARRLEFLSKHLSRTISSDSPIRYQLLHRTVSAVLEAQLHGAAAAVVLVQSFGPDTAANFSDFSEFLNELGGWHRCDEARGVWPLSAGRAARHAHLLPVVAAR